MDFSLFHRRENTVSFQLPNSSDVSVGSLFFEDTTHDSDTATLRPHNTKFIWRALGPLLSCEIFAPLLLFHLREADHYTLRCHWRKWFRADNDRNKVFWIFENFKRRRLSDPADFEPVTDQQNSYEDITTFVSPYNLLYSTAIIISAGTLRGNSVQDELVSFFQECEQSFLGEYLCCSRPSTIHKVSEFSSILKTNELSASTAFIYPQKYDSNTVPESIKSFDTVESNEVVKTYSRSNDFFAIYYSDNESDADVCNRHPETAATSAEDNPKSVPDDTPIRIPLEGKSYSLTDLCFSSVATVVTPDPKIAGKNEVYEPRIVKWLQKQSVSSPLLERNLRSVGISDQVVVDCRYSEDMSSAAKPEEATIPVMLEISRNDGNKVELVETQDNAVEVRENIKDDSGTSKTSDEVSDIAELTSLLVRDSPLHSKSNSPKDRGADSSKCELSIVSNPTYHAASGAPDSDENPELFVENKDWTDIFTDSDAIGMTPKIKLRLSFRWFKKLMKNFNTTVVGQLQDNEQYISENSESIQVYMKESDEPETQSYAEKEFQPSYHECECWADTSVASIRCVIAHHRAIALMLEGTPLGESSKSESQLDPEAESVPKCVSEINTVKIEFSNYETEINSEHWLRTLRPLRHWSEVQPEAPPEVQVSEEPEASENASETAVKIGSQRASEPEPEPESENRFFLKVNRQSDDSSEYNSFDELQNVIILSENVDRDFALRSLPSKLDPHVKDNEDIAQNEFTGTENIGREIVLSGLVPDSPPEKLVRKLQYETFEEPRGVLAYAPITPPSLSIDNDHSTNSSISIARLTPLQTSLPQPVPSSQEQLRQCLPQPRREASKHSAPSNLPSQNISNCIQMIQMICLPAAPNPFTMVELQPKNFNYHYNRNIVHIPCNMEHICKQLIEMGLGSRKSFRYYFRTPPKSMNDPVFISDTAVTVGQVPSMLGRFITDGAINLLDVSEIYFGACPYYSTNSRNVSNVDEFVHHLQAIQETVLEAKGVVLSRWLETPTYHFTGFEYSKNPYSLPNPPPCQIPMPHHYGIYSLKRRHPHLGLLFSLARLDEQARRIKGRIKFELGIY